MFRSIFQICALIGLTLVGIHCNACSDHPKPCSSLSDLEPEMDCFKAWSEKKCPTNETVVEKAEIEKYKGCIKTYIEPCVQEKEDELFKEIFVKLFDKYDLCKVCSNEIQDKVESDLIDIYMDNKETIEKRGEVKCSMIKQAMQNVKKCAGIE